MPWWGILLIVIMVVFLALTIFALTYGRKLQARQESTKEQMDAIKQTVTILVIDKAKKKLKEAGLPDAVIAETPKYARRMKVPVVRAKVGNRVMNLVADADVFQIIPLKKTCTVTISGIYITEVKSVRGGTVQKIVKKKRWIDKLREKVEKADKANKK